MFQILSVQLKTTERSAYNTCTEQRQITKQGLEYKPFGMEKSWTPEGNMERTVASKEVRSRQYA
jgi:hypothetical protein